MLRSDSQSGNVQFIDTKHFDVFDRTSIRLAPFFEFDSLNVLESDTYNPKGQSQSKQEGGETYQRR